MHPATCAQCGDDCQVPFKPTGDKPVYCSKCFSERNGGDNRRSYDRDSGGRSNQYNRNDRSPQRSAAPNYHKQFDELNRKIDSLFDLVHSMLPQKEQPQEKSTLPKKVEPKAPRAKKVVLEEKLVKKATKKATKKKPVTAK